MVGGQKMIVNKKDMEWTEEEKARIIEKFSDAKLQDFHLIKDVKGESMTVTETMVQQHQSLFLKSCEDCHCIIEAPCVKILIEGCNGTKITLSGKIKTEVMEVWKCNNTTIEINTTVKTVQADLSKQLTVTYDRAELFQTLIWSGVYDLSLDIEKGKHNLVTGFTQRQADYADLSDQIDQFIIRFVDDKLKEEQVIRLDNGFPTTEREAKEFEEKQKAAEEAKEKYMRGLVKWAAPRLGIKDDRKRPKVGRNQSCPCGSNQKFKKCCWSKYEDSAE